MEISKRTQLLILISLIIPLTLCAQRVQRVCGEYIYYAEENESLNEAKRAALERARLNALAREFGTVISQNTMMRDVAVDGKENSYFSQLSAIEVKGEWIEDVGEAEYETSFEQETLIVKCKVCGKARELSNDAVDFTATILRNGTEERFADTDFRDGDDMFLLFHAPVDGYVAAYLVDENPTAYCLLPYMADTDGQQSVKHGEEYIFFSPNKTREKSDIVDEYTLTCNNSREHNQVYVIFSPKPFTKALDSQVNDGIPRQLDFEEFQKWLSTCRKRDTRMGVKVIHINIEKRN